MVFIIWAWAFLRASANMTQQLASVRRLPCGTQDRRLASFNFPSPSLSPLLAPQLYLYTYSVPTHSAPLHLSPTLPVSLSTRLHLLRSVFSASFRLCLHLPPDLSSCLSPRLSPWTGRWTAPSALGLRLAVDDSLGSPLAAVVGRGSPVTMTASLDKCHVRPRRGTSLCRPPVAARHLPPRRRRGRVSSWTAAITNTNSWCWYDIPTCQANSYEYRYEQRTGSGETARGGDEVWSSYPADVLYTSGPLL